MGKTLRSYPWASNAKSRPLVWTAKDTGKRVRLPMPPNNATRIERWRIDVFRDVYWLRDLTDKLARRARRLLGRADSKPWILRPKSAGAGGAYVDFIIGIDFLHNQAKLVQMFHQALSPLGLSLLLANKHNASDIAAKVKSGQLRPHVYLDLCSATNPQFTELLRTCAAAGIHSIGDPAKLDIWTWKARAQKKLEDAGLPVPPTVLIRAGEASRELTPAERAAVGEKCVIKPSWGVAGKGVIANVKPTMENIETARQFDPKDDYLIQRMIKWEYFGNRAAYLRGYNILGTRTLLWWSPDTRTYEQVTWDELRQHDLMGAIDLVDRMARLTGMDFFSSEIAITNGINQPRFVLIDYCNDQCDINPASVQADGPPDEWVAWVVERFAEFIWKEKTGVTQTDGHAVWLAPSAIRAASSQMKPASSAPHITHAA